MVDYKKSLFPGSLVTRYETSCLVLTIESDQEGSNCSLALTQLWSAFRRWSVTARWWGREVANPLCVGQRRVAPRCCRAAAGGAWGRRKGGQGAPRPPSAPSRPRGLCSDRPWLARTGTAPEQGRRRRRRRAGAGLRRGRCRDTGRRARAAPAGPAAPAEAARQLPGGLAPGRGGTWRPARYRHRGRSGSQGHSASLEHVCQRAPPGARPGQDLSAKTLSNDGKQTE